MRSTAKSLDLVPKTIDNSFSILYYYFSGGVMQTEVILQRPLFNGVVKQSSKTGFLSATDLVNVGNQWRASKGLPVFQLENYWNSPSTKEFIAVLEKQVCLPCKQIKRGKFGGTWVHPFVFIDIALSIAPELKIEVYQWLTDELLKYRNESGDSYKKMCGAIYEIVSNKKEFQKELCKVNAAIHKACNINDWNLATEAQLKLRDSIHEYIAILADVMHSSLPALVSVAISKAKKSLGC